MIPRQRDPFFMPDCCANCDAALALENQTLFCGEFCRQVADFVRYARGVVRDPARANDPEVVEAIRVRMAIFLGGGYPTGERHLSPAQRTAVIDRDGGKCRECGAPAKEIDHIAGSSADPSNLQLLCHDCHMSKTKGSFVPANDLQRAWAKELWDTRIYRDAPLRLSDDTERWGKEWRALKKDRAERLWQRVETKTGRQRAEFKGLIWAAVVDAVLGS
jgi:5-methylcytosine-specific restriction endonuclease McrA